MTDETNAPYTVGQVVVYKSGGGRMTVERCIPASEATALVALGSNWAVLVNWLQDDGVPHERLIDAAMLELYRSNYEKMMAGAQLALKDLESRHQA